MYASKSTTTSTSLTVASSASGWLAGGFGVLEDNIVIDIDLRVGLHRAIARRAVFGNLNAQLAREIVRRMITYPWAQ